MHKIDILVCFSQIVSNKVNISYSYDFTRNVVSKLFYPIIAMFLFCVDESPC